LLCLPVILYAIRLCRIDRKRIGLVTSICFYCTYQFARVIGTITGVCKKL
jgi:hypothetical protein